MNLKTFYSLFFTFLFTSCLFSTNSFAQNVTSSNRTTSYTSKSYAYKLTEQDFANTPSWIPEQEETPLSVNRAVKIARENLPRFVESAETWKFQNILLQRMGENKWYYRIHFSCFGTICRELKDRTFMAIVKMDGTIVEPKKVTIEE